MSNPWDLEAEGGEAGGAFVGYQGQIRKVMMSAWVLRYPHQMAGRSHSHSAAARSAQ